MNLAKFPRRTYTEYKTPIEFLKNLTKELNGPNIYIKRDDLLGLTLGGNKTRKLEFLMADALRQGADTILTCGAVQSNHCRLTLSAAVKEGLKCQLILEERVPNSYNPESSGNNFLYKLLGVEAIRVVKGGSDMEAELEKLAEELRSQGRKPYIIAGGGSTFLGDLGYVACAQEITEQMFDMSLSFDHIVLCGSSAGTHAGLLAGFIGTNMHIPISAISVNRDSEAQIDRVFEMTRTICKELGIENEVKKEDVLVIDDYIGPGYSMPTQESIDAIRLLAKTEGILTDPTYTGKTLAGIIGLIKKGYFKYDENILFLHTGGLPGVFLNEDLILNGLE